MSDRRDIKSLGHEGLVELFAQLGQPSYRAAQVERWLYQRGAKAFSEMTDLPSALREGLGESWDLGSTEVVERQVSRDGTRKYLVRFDDGAAVETVGLPAGDRLTVCFSTQAGCAMACRFCATGQGGLERNLMPGEIVDQVRTVAEDFGRRVTNAVAMGQGEPFANYDATLTALRLLGSKDGLGIGARHLTVSTCGLLPGIRRFAGEPEQYTLAVSLHSAVQRTRDELMPAMRTYPLRRLRDELVAYSSATGRRPTLEFALIAGVNDTDGELDALIAFCRGMLCHVNLIPINPVSDTRFERAPEPRVQRFLQRLTSSGVEASIRAERGTDIAAACGQLSGGRR